MGRESGLYDEDEMVIMGYFNFSILVIVTGVITLNYCLECYEYDTMETTITGMLSACFWTYGVVVCFQFV